VPQAAFGKYVVNGLFRVLLFTYGTLPVADSRIGLPTITLMMKTVCAEKLMMPQGIIDLIFHNGLAGLTW
jgi:hypothetical protein